MLVLTRKSGESVCIGDDVEVRIVSIHGQKVRLAIDAPRTLSVRRKELVKKDAGDRLRLADDAPAAPVARAKRQRTLARRRVAS